MLKVPPPTNLFQVHRRPLPLAVTYNTKVCVRCGSEATNECWVEPYTQDAWYLCTEHWETEATHPQMAIDVGVFELRTTSGNYEALNYVITLPSSYDIDCTYCPTKAYALVHEWQTTDGRYEKTSRCRLHVPQESYVLINRAVIEPDSSLSLDELRRVLQKNKALAEENQVLRQALGLAADAGVSLTPDAKPEAESVSVPAAGRPNPLKSRRMLS